MLFLNKDRYLRLCDENSVVKRVCNEQENKIIRLATKLLRMASSSSANGADSSTAESLCDGETNAKRADRLEFLVGRIDELTAK